MSKSDECRCRGDVDNQIGYLHNRLRMKVNCPPVKLLGFELNLLEKYPYVFSIKDAVILEVALKARDFVNAIPFDNTLSLITDNNPPKSTIFNQMENYDKRKGINDPKQWMSV